ncbi:2575_t:CDS:10 [Acaulospora morrowiae]|uniref:2575_t:CDS:1 n=1 Tax=Acaulospora morrowiae TaxID=94023 RepID=A0A9N8ZPJ3_9GLOM|nr:2575_t:CDS:10 [Acaulospora morrowiae]
MKPQYTESHFARFTSWERTNIYGLSVFETKMMSGLPISLKFPSGLINNKEAVAFNDPEQSDEQKIYKHLFVSSFYSVICFVSALGYWSTIELPLDRNIGEIVSIDAFSSIRSELVFALTAIYQGQDGESVHTLRIYSSDDRPSTTCMEKATFNITEKRLFDLHFTPMQLSHTKIKVDGEIRVGILLCGTDEAVHLYLENNTPLGWEEQSIQDYFPLFASLKANILSLEIKEINDLKILAAGCQNGMLYMSIMKLNSETGEYEQFEEHSSVALFSPITSVLVFSSSTSKINPGGIHMLVTCAVEQAIVYRNIDKHSLTYPMYLEECTKYDSVLCSHVMDVDWDGKNEIIVGTYGRELLIYKQITNEDPNDPISFELLFQKSFSYPIYRITGIDLNQDGIEELIVVTQYGTHILQPNLDAAKEELLLALKNLELLRQERKAISDVSPVVTFSITCLLPDLAPVISADKFDKLNTNCTYNNQLCSRKIAVTEPKMQTDQKDEKEKKQLERSQCPMVVEYDLLSIDKSCYPCAASVFEEYLFKVIRASSKAKHTIHGIKEVNRSLPCDATPLTLIQHLPSLCKSNQIPYVYVKSKSDLGFACKARRPTAALMIIPDDNNNNETYAYKSRYNKIINKLKSYFHNS